jgi:hypothetical protein
MPDPDIKTETTETKTEKNTSIDEDEDETTIPNLISYQNNIKVERDLSLPALVFVEVKNKDLIYKTTVYKDKDSSPLKDTSAC